MPKLLIADPLFTKFSHVYFVGKKALEYVTFKPEVELVPFNNYTFKAPLPYDIAEQIIFHLIDNYIACRQVSFALPLINISKSIQKRFYLKYFKTGMVIDRSSPIGYNARLSPIFNMFRLTDDHFIDLLAYPNGTNEGTMFTIKLYFEGNHFDLGRIYPWNFDGDVEVGTILPPFILSYQNGVPENDLVAEVITGPTQYEILYVKGKARADGVIDTHYLKSPIIIYQLYHYIPLDINTQIFEDDEWQSFGHLARAFFGPNAGIFVHLTDNLPEGLMDRPVIYEI